MRTYIRTEVHNHVDQKITIQPTPEFDGIEIYFCEEDGSHATGVLYLTKDELPIFIERLQDMMNYATK